MPDAYGAPTVGKHTDGEKVIYLHTHRIRKGSIRDAKSEWYAIKQTDNGAEISRVFEEITPDNPGDGLLFTRCEAVGSSLFIIGGYDHRKKTYSNAVVCLDTCKPGEGWKHCFSLPFPCCKAYTGVYGRWMYVLFGQREFIMDMFPNPWGYVFNIDTKEGHILRRPSDMTNYTEAIGAVESGLVLYSDSHTFYLQEPSSHDWTLYFQNKIDPPPYCDCHVVSDGIMYLYDGSTRLLYAYDLKLCKRLPEIRLPKHERFCDYAPVDLVSVAKGKLCLISTIERCFPDGMFLFYFEFSVCHDDSSPKAVIEELKMFKIGAHDLVKCVAVDPCQDRVVVNSNQPYDLEEGKAEKEG